MTIKCPDDSVIEQAFAERILFYDEKKDNSGLPGHPRDNIKELFVSAVNSYFDPRFSEVLAKLEGETKIRMKKMYDEIIGLLQERITKKRSSSFG